MTGPPSPSREEELALADATLHLEHFAPAGPPRGVVVAVHGFAAHCGLYRNVGASLAARGFAVTQFDCRGHGRSTGRRGHVVRFAQYIADLQAVVERARAVAPGAGLALMGHSHGGTIVLEAVLGGTLTPDRLVLAAPWLDLVMPVPWYKRLPAPLMASLWPGLTMHNGIRGVDVSRNPLVVENFDRDPLVHHVATARWFHEVLVTQARIRAAAANLRVPTLLLVVGHDKIVSTEAALTLAKVAGSTIAVRRYEALYHEMFLEPERDQVVADIAAWLVGKTDESVDLGRAPPAVPGII